MKILLVGISGVVCLLALSCSSLRSGADVIFPFRAGSGPGASVMVIRSDSVVFAECLAAHVARRLNGELFR